MLVELGLVEQRYKAVCEVLDGANVTEVARTNGVARQTVRTWLRRCASLVKGANIPSNDLPPFDVPMQFGSQRSAGVPDTPVWLRGHRMVLVDKAARHVMTMDMQRWGSGGDSTAGHRRTEVDATMRTLSVEVPGVPAEDSLELAMTDDEDPVEAFCPHRPHPTLCVGVGPRGSNRRLDHSDALAVEHCVEAGGELGVPVPDQELDGATAVGEITGQVVSNLGDERGSRMVGDPEDVHLPGRQLDNEEHVELLERHGVHREEVRGEHAVGLGTKEPRPGRAAPWSRPKTMSTQDPSDRAGRDADGECPRLALGTDTAPTSVRPTQPNGEPDQLVAHRWPPRPPVGFSTAATCAWPHPGAIAAAFRG